MTTHPNILLIVCDQLRADHTGFGGSALVQTPHLDRLAEAGRVFSRAHVANPICMPNRASMLTGRVPSAHGVVANTGALPWTTHTFVRRLRQSGYHTALVGKADLQNGLRRLFEAQPTDMAPLGDPYAPGWDRVEDLERFVTEPFEDPADYYGFAELGLTLGHGDMVGGHHQRWVLAQGYPQDELTLWGPANALEVSDSWWQVYKTRLPQELSTTSYVTETTIDVIDRAAGRSDPWFVQCSFPDPHHPFAASGEWFHRHEPADVALPATFDHDLSSAPAHLRGFRSLAHSELLVQMFGCTADELRAAAAAEAGSIEAIDHGIGRILGALERTGRADDTVVVFTSDHGDMFGDHGLMLKGMMHFEGCTRVPLVVAGPGVTSGGQTPALASSLDLAPTLLDLAGIDGYEGIQGQSLAPVLIDPGARVRDHIYIEEDFPQAAFFPFPVPSQARTLITETARLTRYSSPSDGELYDLGDDPLELDNRWESDASRRRDLGEALLDAVVAHSVPPRLGDLAPA